MGKSEMELFAEKWCNEKNIDITNLNDKQINELCSAWTIKVLNIPFKTIDEWRKENE
jgi:hypothetical protein